MNWNEYQDICEVIDRTDESRLKKTLLKKEIKKTLRRAGYFDYKLFPESFRWNLCAARMRQGKFDNYDGWEYRSDWSITFQGWNGYKNPLPKWDGRPVDKLLILGEQGIGDEILFASAIPELIVRLGRDKLVFHTYPRLIPIVERSYGIRCEPRRFLSEYTDGDAVVALGDLFMFYRRDKSHFPRKPFFKPDPVKVEFWKKKLGDRKTIGIAWKARHGSLNPEDLRTEDATYINLQYGQKCPDWIEDLGVDPLTNLDDQLNLIAALDKVVTVTQTVVHLCGSIGKECSAIRPPKNGEVINDLWYYGTGGPMIPYGVHVYNSIADFRRSI